MVARVSQWEGVWTAGENKGSKVKVTGELCWPVQEGGLFRTVIKLKVVLTRWLSQFKKYEKIGQRLTLEPHESFAQTSVSYMSQPLL